MRRTVLIAALAAFAVFVALNLDTWRTGRVETEPLDLAPGGAPVPEPDRIWIDTDAACGAGGRTDPDDCLAIAWLAARHADVAGISTAFGNADGQVVADTARRLVAGLADDGGPPFPVWVGAASPGAAATPASGALQAALHDEPLTILALGPLTNVAAALRGRADLQARVSRIVAVMGRRPGHLFHPTEGRGQHPLLGHGPIFSDLNFAEDIEAARDVLAMEVPLTFVPYDAARTTVITAGDVARLARTVPEFAEAPGWTRDWLAFWDDVVGLPGFYPFDWVAAASLERPDLFACAPVVAAVRTEWEFWLVPRKGLVVEAPAPGAAGNARYCPSVSGRLHGILVGPSDIPGDS